MYYSQLTLDTIPEEHRSLLTAFANTAKYYESDVNPDNLYRRITSDDPVIDYEVLPEYVPELVVKGTGSDTWPEDNGSILHVRRYDENKMYYVDHYLLVIDASQKAVVDSYDGIIKDGESYGSIVDWVTYGLAPEPKEPIARTAHIVGPGENLWDAARKLNVKVEELIDFNTIDDPRSVSEGYVLYLPARETLTNETVRYEILPTPENMHVSRVGGSRKLSFGNARVFDDIFETGRTHAENSNHKIYAIAYVDLDDSDAPAAYYMEREDMGECASTGRVKYTIGFNHSHMSPGHVVPGESQLTPEVVEKIDEAQVAADALKEENRQEVIEEVEVADVVDDVLEVEAVETTVEKPKSWKDTLTYLRDDGKPETYKAKESFIVRDPDAVLPPRPFARKQEIALTYGVMINGVLYGLPQSFVDKTMWYLFPLEKLEPAEDESLYNVDVSISDKLLLRNRLSASEKSVVVFAKVMGFGTRVKQIIKRKVTK